MVHCPVQNQAKLIKIKGLCQVVVGPVFQGFHGGLHRGIGGHDNNRDGGVIGFDGRKGLKP